MGRQKNIAKIIRTSTVPVSLNILLKGQLRFLAQFYKVTAVSGNGEHLRQVSEREGVHTIPLQMQRKISPFKDFKSLVQMYFLLKRERPQIVHSITPKAGLISMLAAKFAGVPIRMHTFTGLIFPSRSGLMQRILIIMDKVLCAAATNIYPEGEGVKKDLIKFKITKKPLKVLGNGNVNGIDLEYYSARTVAEEQKISLKKFLGIKNNDRVFVFVGRMVRDKGINELVEAFAKLQKSNCKLLLVGPSEQELDPLLPNIIAEIESNKNIISVGFQTDIRPYLAISHVFVFPSYREGFPNVVLQAGAMGLPCIVTDISGSNEIINDGINGIVISPKNSSDLLKAMHLAEENSEMFANFAKISREIIANKYSQELVWQLLKNEYDTLLSIKA